MMGNQRAAAPRRGVGRGVLTRHLLTVQLHPRCFLAHAYWRGLQRPLHVCFPGDGKLLSSLTRDRDAVQLSPALRTSAGQTAK